MSALIVLCIGAMYAIFYGINADDDFRPYRRVYDEKRLSENAVSGFSPVRKVDGKPVLWIRERESIIGIEGLANDAYIFDISLLPINKYEKGQIIEFYFDGRPVKTIELRNIRRWQRFFFTVPLKTIENRGLLTIANRSEKTSPIGIKNIQIKNHLRNNHGILKGYLLLDGYYKERRFPFNVYHADFPKYGLIMLFTVLYWSGHLFVLKWFSGKLSEKQINVSWRIFLPGLIIVACVGIFSLSTQYNILYPTRTFFVLTLIPLVIVQFYQLFKYGDPERIISLTKRYIAFPVIVLVYLFVLIQYSGRFKENVTGFMVIGDYFKAPHIWTEDTFIYENNYGYDGQFYYYIAHDPFLKATNYNHIDLPPYRYGRIGYPFLVYIASLGNKSLMPYMMLAINIAAVIGGMLFTIKIAGHFDQKSEIPGSRIPLSWSTIPDPQRAGYIGSYISPQGIAALLYALVPGLLLSTLRCLPEPVALFFVIGGMFYYLTGRDMIAALFLSASVLTRETSFIAVISALAVLAIKRDFKKASFYLMPFGAYMLWQLNIFTHFGTISQTGSARDIGFPFRGMVSLIDSLMRRDAPLKYRFFEVIYVTAMMSGITAASIKFYRGIKVLVTDSIDSINPFRIALFLYAVLAVLLNYRIWVEPWSYVRVTGEFAVFLFLSYLTDRDRLSILPLLLFVIAFFAELFWLDIFL